MIIHASCIAINGEAVLLMGAPGAGKSDVALRLMDRGAVLVADDQTELKLSGTDVLASPPAALEGMIELRYVGLLQGRAFVREIPIRLVVTLVGKEEKLERLPCSAAYSLLDQPVRWLKLVGAEASTPAKIWFALHGVFHDAE